MGEETGSMENDFGTEFEEVKCLSTQEAANDPLIQELRIQRQIRDTLKKQKLQDVQQDAMEEHEISTGKSATKIESNIKVEDGPVPDKLGPTIPSTMPRKRTQMINLKKVKLFNSNKGPIPYDITNDQKDIDLDSKSEYSRSGIPKKPTMPNLAVALQHLQKFNSGRPKNSYSIEDITKVKKTILAQLSGKLGNLDILQTSLSEKYKEIYRMFEHTIKDNESHSALIIGPRSVGKSEIISKAIKELELLYPQKFITIRLNAFHQHDESTALREIARQLDVGFAKLKGTVVEISGNFEQRSLSDTFANILNTLETNHSTDNSLSIIFVIEEIERFTLPSKQTLLYNLFDLSQNSSTPVCVCGSTTKITTRELLEKRVKSRFSQRIISINKPRQLDEFWNNAKLGLLLPQSVIDTLDDPKYGTTWNETIHSTYNDNTENSILRKLVIHVFYTTKNYRDFNNMVKFAVSKISVLEPLPRDANFLAYLQNQSVNPIQSITLSLSELEQLLIIAAARWVEKYELQVVNFNLAYREYEEMIKAYNISSTTINTANASAADSNILTNIKVTQRIWPQSVLRNCWENLYRAELLVEPPTAPTTEKLPGYSAGVIEADRMVSVDVSLEELGHIMEDHSFGKKFTRL